MKTLVLLFFIVSCSAINATNLPLDTVNHVEVERYLGKWYEIARFDQSFQKGCTATEANYSLRKDGDIRVMNSCRLGNPNGELKTSEGRAWIKDKNTNAKLKVQFFLKNIKLPFFAGNYWILELDQDYQYVIIGEPSRKYLWILSRTKIMEPKLYEELVRKAKDLNFDVTKLLKATY